MWGYVTGALSVPSNKKAANYAELLSNWEVNNTKIIPWLNNSIDQSIGIHLAKFATAK